MIYLPFLILLILTIFYWRKHGLNVGVYIMVIYTFSAFFSILLFNSEGFRRDPLFLLKRDITIVPIFTYCFAIFFITKPILNYDVNFGISNLLRSNRFTKIANVLKYFFIANLFIVCYFTFQDIQELDFSDFSDIRSQVYSDQINVGEYSGIYYYLKVVSNYISALWPIAILIFFYLSCKKSQILMKLLLLLSSLSTVISSITIAGRTQIVYWILTMVFFYLLFNRFLSSKANRYIKALITILFVGILFYFALITISRWGHEDMYQSILEYIGQPFINFNYFFNNYSNVTIEFSRIFPLIDLLFSGDFSLEEYRNYVYRFSGMDIGIFYTFLGDILVDLGHVGLYIFIFLMIICNIVFIRRRSRYAGANIFILIVVSLILLQGLFYYPFWQPSGGVFILFCIITFLIIILQKPKLK
ncbi:O-antigen polymerase [Chryseobacterium sp. A301]